MALETDDFFLLLGTLLEERRAALKGSGRIAFAVTGSAGYLLDLSAPRPVRAGFDPAADTIVVCNRLGLSRLLESAPAAAAPGAGQPLFLWAGAAGPLLSVARALGGSATLFATRIAVMTGACP